MQGEQNHDINVELAAGKRTNIFWSAVVSRQYNPKRNESWHKLNIAIKCIEKKRLLCTNKNIW